MTHDHDHHSHEHHGHAHPHEHRPVDETTAAAAAADAQGVGDRDLSPSELSRRNLLRMAGVTGGTAALGMTGMTGVGAGSAAAAPSPVARPGRGGAAARFWLAGDHHIHTQHSSDGQYTVLDQTQHGAAYGLDWMVITDHGGPTHARLGVDLVNPDIVAAREKLAGTLIFQGLEWNIPAAEHGTVFVAPGDNEVAVLKQFENTYDGGVAPDPDEALAVAGIQWLGKQVDRRRVGDALFLANHPARNGIDSPHEIRAWRDADPRIAIGFEGAPGHQAAGLPAGYGPGSSRGFYGNAARPDSFAGYPPESYRTWGGFDWMTSTVGGLWDSLLAEGKPWSISANSDSHVNWSDTSRRPDGSSSEQFNADGRYGDPVYAGEINLSAGDFWPGFYSRTHVGAARRDYASVMAGMRAGRMWVDHGRLVEAVDVKVRARGRGGVREATLGGTLRPRRGERVQLAVTVVAQSLPNWAQFLPSLNRVDLVRGVVEADRGSSDQDRFLAPDTRVVKQWDTSGRTGTFTLRYDLGEADEAFYVRLRGTDGNRQQPGFLGADVDPAGPAIDVTGDADPWADLWFYTNPVWVAPVR
ncbi:histidinol-phosphatase [Nocardioides sp. AX2bis]|uniref:histidinol-phosphatase n=1 Tax=Nocardioides sp. AX2bis TaxID=2653157 RepID=UPI0012F3A4C6|nr:histidinol-phosphatase [Nocardioides sp. AX2bis]VXA93640.1 Histidinol phosphatase [Nocardioides sp. AX2bis]